MELPHEVRALREKLPKKRTYPRHMGVSDFTIETPLPKGWRRVVPDPELGLELLWMAYYLERMREIVVIGEHLKPGDPEALWLVDYVGSAGRIYGVRQKWRGKRRSLQVVRDTLEELVRAVSGEFFGERTRLRRSKEVYAAVLAEVRREALADFVELCGMDNLGRDHLARSPLAREKKPPRPAAKAEPVAPGSAPVEAKAPEAVPEKETVMEEHATSEKPEKEPGRLRQFATRALEVAKKPLVWGGVVAVVIVGGVAYLVFRDGGGEEEEGGAADGAGTETASGF